MRALLPLVLLALACAARRPEPVGRVVFIDPPPGTPYPDASAPADASAAPDASPARPPRPMVAVLPTLTLDNLRFRDVSECARGACVHPRSPLAPAAVAAEDGATTLPPTSAWVQIIRPGASVRVPHDSAIDLLGVTLTGTAVLDEVVPRAAAAPTARPWTAFRYPGAGAVLRASGAAPVALLLVTATGTISPESGAPIPARTSLYRAVTRDLTAAETLTWANGAMHARIAFDATDSPRASLELLFASDDAPVAEHAHPGSWETLVALSAAGHLHLPAQRVGERDLPVHDRTVTDGTIVYVPADVRHAWAPDGTHPLVAVQVYSPPGPEQRFRALGHPTTPTP